MDRTILNPLPAEDVVSSIREHLAVLLNARHGSLHHLPDYGLPDLGEIYAKLPESLPYLKSALQNVIHRYEPRLYHTYIEFKPVNNPSDVICLTIFATLCNGETLTLDVNFLSSGIVILL